MDASIAQILECTEAEGPGRRFAVWFQGCPLRCAGCCNPEFLTFRDDRQIPLWTIQKQLEEAAKRDQLEGLTLLGGEPFAHAVTALELARTARRLDLGVMVFTGYLLEDLRTRQDQTTEELLAHIDLLIDGPFRQEEPDSVRRWIGSRNQRQHFFTDRYQADAPYWAKRNTLEVRVRGGEVVVNGFPAIDAKTLWKGWTRRPRPTP
ncbi:MAG: 4Fe-4S single cluster domain-containing protein [Gemmataceae bacterium]